MALGALAAGLVVAVLRLAPVKLDAGGTGGGQYALWSWSRRVSLGENGELQMVQRARRFPSTRVRNQYGSHLLRTDLGTIHRKLLAMGSVVEDSTEDSSALPTIRARYRR